MVTVNATLREAIVNAANKKETRLNVEGAAERNARQSRFEKELIDSRGTMDLEGMAQLERKEYWAGKESRQEGHK